MLRQMLERHHRGRPSLFIGKLCEVSHVLTCQGARTYVPFVPPCSLCLERTQGEALDTNVIHQDETLFVGRRAPASSDRGQTTIYFLDC